jgi:hypothetical protein
VQTTYIDGRVEDNSLDEIFPDTSDDMVINLNSVNGRNGFKLLRTISLQNTRKCLMIFSESGKLFAIFN